MINCTHEKQRGAIILIVGIALVVLLGFVGLVIDLGGLFVAKTELQSALDSCALSAAQELDGAADALTRATNAGKTARNRNKFEYQKIVASTLPVDITFSDSLTGSFIANFTPVAKAKYAQCRNTTPGITAYFIELVGGAATNSVGAVAIATRTHGQSSCPIPIGLLPKPGGTAANNYNFKGGEWATMLYGGASPSPGEMGWYNLNGSTSGSELANELTYGYCNSSVGNSVKTPGAKSNVDALWNSRFGIYKQSPSFTAIGMAPDYSGYAYTSTNWTNAVPQNAYSGTPATGSDPTAFNFIAQRKVFANYDPAAPGTVNGGDAITGLVLHGGEHTLATGGVGGQLQLYGENRRLVLVPVVSPASTILDYACMLILQPVTPGSSNPIQLEFLGKAGDVNSPCSSNGLAGGATGPLIPALVE